jgi:peptidyl-prolyl cis-trans isomerase SurA
MNVSFNMRNVASTMSRIKYTVALLCAAFAIAPAADAQQAAQPPSMPAAAAAAAAPTARVASREPKPVDSIAAVVNNEVITRQELADRMSAVEKRMAAQGVALPPRTQLQAQLLERMIVERAEIQLAKEDGIKVDDALLDRALERIAEQNKLTMPQFRVQLDREGIAYPAFREQIRDEIMMQRVREREVDSKLQISDSEIDNYLAAEASAGPHAQELNVAQILVRVPENPSPEQLADRRKRAEEIYQQVRTGGDFGKIAATYSDASDAMNGGDLGWRSADRLPQLFADAVANLKPGELAPIVRSGNGFHILKLVGRRSSAGASASAAPAPVQQTHVRHILIKVSQVVTAAEARRKLVELKQRLDNKAATFEELAKLYSNDLSASKGGDLGWVYPGDTVPEFERAMNELKPGEVSEPVETPFGFHLIQVLERKSDEVSQERQRTAARAAIRERKLEEATEDWLRELRDRAYVEIRTDQN